MLQVQANGLTSDVRLERAEIRVCEKKCTTVDSESSDSIYTCMTPAISTTQSNSVFEIQEESNLKGEKVIFNGMTQEQAESTFDDSILPSISSTSADCYVGIQFPTGYVGVVNEVSFFLDEFSVENIVDHLLIEASSDNFDTSVELLVEVSEEAHEGWNYYSVEDLAPKYQYYRLRSNATSTGCDSIGEIHFFGFEVIEDDNDSYDCPVELVQYVEDTLLQVIEEQKTALTSVTYEIDRTPAVSDVSPRWGSVVGAQTVTFTGINFNSADPADYSVTIDDVTCVVQTVSSTEI